MRVRDLRSALEEVKGIFQDAKARAQQEDIEALLHLLDDQEDQHLDEFLANLRKALAPSSVDEVTVSKYIQELTDAGTSDVAFGDTLKRLGDDSRVRKQELVIIAQRYLGKRRHVKARDSVKTIHDTLRAHFNEMRYEKQSRDLARRATPV